MTRPWWYVGRWQAFVAGLLLALSFVVVWAGTTYSYTLTNFTVHEPGETVTYEGVTYEYLGMVRTTVGTGSGQVTLANPGMTYVAVVLNVTPEPDNNGVYCPLGLTNTDQSMIWSTDVSHVVAPQFRSPCYEAPPGETTAVVTVIEVPTSQAENIGGIVIPASSWRHISEVIR